MAIQRYIISVVIILYFSFGLLAEAVLLSDAAKLFLKISKESNVRRPCSDKDFLSKDRVHLCNKVLYEWSSKCMEETPQPEACREGTIQLHDKTTLENQPIISCQDGEFYLWGVIRSDGTVSVLKPKRLLHVHGNVRLPKKLREAYDKVNPTEGNVFELVELIFKLYY